MQLATFPTRPSSDEAAVAPRQPLTLGTLTCEKVPRCLSSVHPLKGTHSFSLCKLSLGLIAQPRQRGGAGGSRHSGTSSRAAARLNNEARAAAAAAAFKAISTRPINDELCVAGVPLPATHFHQRSLALILGCF